MSMVAEYSRRNGMDGAPNDKPGKATLVLRPNEEFTQPDYSVIYKAPDGWELGVGRIFHDTSARRGGELP